jgi:hypothetical protein
MVPALFMPSVSRITTLLLDVLSRSLLMAVAKPMPTAVPPVIRPVRACTKSCFSTSWSVVRGHCVNASPS